ncbi:unnamed protein product, partial [Tenebrio molitor]
HSLTNGILDLLNCLHKLISPVIIILFITTMSLQAKIVLASACVFSTGIIGYVHYKQYLDSFKMKNVNFRQQLHQGVLTDMERRQRRKQENLYVLQQQIDLAKEIRKEEERHHPQVT